MGPRVAPSVLLRPSSRQRRSSRSSDPRRLSGVASRRSSAEWLLHFDPRTALDPHSPFLKAWHQVLLLALVFQCFLLPYATVFVRAPDEPTPPPKLPFLLQRAEFLAFYGVEVLFLVDFYVKLNTGFYEDGNIYRDASRSRIKYLLSVGFVLDVVAIVPFALVVKPSAIVVTPVWLEYHKFLRLWRVPEYFATLEDLYAKFFVTLKIVKVVVVTAFLTHVLTCSRVSFGLRTAAGAHDELWLPANGHSSSIYLRSFFWTFGLLTGVYEGELPRASDEFAFSIVVLLSGFLLFSYLCAVFFVLSKSERTKSTAAEARLNQLKHMLCYYRVPESLRTQAVEYVKRYHTDAESNNREVVKLLCPSIARDVQVELLRDTVSTIPLFKGCSSQFIIALTSLLEMVSLPADFELFATGDPGDCMYIVSSGVLFILVAGARVRELRSGSFFGEVSVFSKRPRSATVVTASYCSLYKLSRFYIERVLEGYPQYAETIAHAVDTILSQHPSSGGASPTKGPDPNDFLLTTLFQDPSENTPVPSLKQPPPNPPSTPTTARRLKHRRSLNAPDEESPDQTIKKASPSKRPQIGRSKSARNVSIARREQLSMLSRRSEREKTEGGNTEAPGQPDEEHKKEKDDYVDHSPTYVPRPKLSRRSQSFFFKRENDTSEATPTLLPPSQRTSTAVDAMQNFYDSLSRLLIKKRQQQSEELVWLSKFVLTKPIPRVSRFRRWWLAALQCVLLFHWFTIPALLGFDLLRANLASTWFFQLVNTCMDLILWADIYGTANLEMLVFNRDDPDKSLTTTQLAVRYIWSESFVADVICMLPYQLIGYAYGSTKLAIVLSVPRLGRVWRLQQHWREWRAQRVQAAVDETSPVTASAQRPTEDWSQTHQLIALTVIVCIFHHVVACSYFALTYYEGFSSGEGGDYGWLPTTDYDPKTNPRGLSVAGLIIHQYTRALVFAASTLTTLGETLEPQSDPQLVYAVACMVLGLLLSASLVDIVHTRFTAATVEQKDFLVTRARIQSFLQSQSAPPEIMQRVNAFLDFWWSSHRGAIASDLLEDLPDSIKREIIRSMCQPAVQTLSLLADVRDVLPQLEKVFVDSIDFILYGQGEIIYRQGDYASGLFFLLDGEVCMIADGSVPRSVPKGGFFGTASLHLSESSVSYAERMTAISGCILLFVSREHLQEMHKTFPTLSMALKALEKRIIDSKLVRAHALKSHRSSVAASFMDRHRIISPAQYLPRLRTLLSKVFQVDDADGEILFDPDSSTSDFWQLWVVVLIVLQSFKVIYEVCFGVASHRVVVSETVTVLCDAFFVLDMFFRGRLGFYEYGNKIMDRAVIRRRYLRSTAFVADVIAIVPLYAINWFITFAGKNHNRVELLSINKLARLVRVKTTIAAAEAQNLNRTLELRLLKIVYYTMMLAHTLGCVWFSFGIASSVGSSWVPDANLQHASGSVQYLSAIFWSFGVMTASTSSALPQTPLQSLFAVVTMLSGLALFAYVVGNLTDVIELRGADTRDFNSQLSSLRHLLTHFALPENLQDKLKTYVFFQRFHSITQEHVLESYLPPSLLTDIRLVHLQPMIVKVAFLAGMEGSVTRMLVSQFQQVIVVKDQHVCRYGDYGSDMFFVFTGIVDVFVPAATLHRLSSETATTGGTIAASTKSIGGEEDGKTSSASQTFASPQLSSSSLLSLTAMKKVNELTPGSYFGEIALFTNKPRSANALARTSCVLYKLSRRSLELVFERYPAWKKRVLKIVNIQQEQQHLRNLYMAEQQHDENRMKQMLKEQAKSAPQSAEGAQPLSPRRLGERLARSSRRLVRRMSAKSNDTKIPHSPPPSDQPAGEVAGAGASSIAPLASTIPGAGVIPHTLPVNKIAPSSTAPDKASLPSPRTTKSVPSKAVAKPKTSKPAQSDLWIDKLLECTEVQSNVHVLWLHIVAAATLFMAVAMPFQVAFDIHCYNDSQGKLIHVILPMATRALSHVCELIFAWDIWMNWNVKESVSSMELYERPHREAYQKQRQLLWDALAAFPFDHFIADFYQSPWLRLNRCLKVINFQHYVDEIYRRSVRYEQTRFVARWLLFLIAMYWCSCAYFVVAQYTTTKPTDSWYQWSPPAICLLKSHQHSSTAEVSPVDQLAMRLQRSFFFAVTVFVKKGKTFGPENEAQLLFTLAISFVGMLTMAIMIGEIAQLYVSYISNEVDFRRHHTALRTYLDRWRIKGKLRQRAHAFLSSLWSSHRGVDYQAILDDIPPEIRNDVVLHVGKVAFEGFVSKCFSPFLPTSMSSKSELEAVMQAIAQQLKYEGFPRDENVIVEGSIAKEMYFVVKGLLMSRSSAESTIAAALASPPMGPDDSISLLPREIRLSSGDFFGEKGLLGYAVSRNVVRTVRACDLLSLSSEALLGVLLSRPVFQTALGIAVEAYRDMTQLLRDKCQHLDADTMDAAALLGLSTPDEPWGDVLLRVIERRQAKWQEQWQAGEITAAQYNMLEPIRELNQPDTCRRMFDNLLRLILPHGSLFSRVASVRNKSRDYQSTHESAGDKMTSATDFHENLPVMMSSERVGMSYISTVSSSGSRDMSSPRRDMSSPRRVQSRTRMVGPSLTAKMLPPTN